MKEAHKLLKRTFSLSAGATSPMVLRDACPRRCYIIYHSYLTHLFKCALTLSVHSILLLSARLKWLNTQPHEAGWCTEKKMLCSMRKQTFFGQRELLRILKAEKNNKKRKQRGERQRCVIRGIISPDVLIATDSISLLLFVSLEHVTNQKNARLLWHVSLGWQRF